MSPLLTYHQLTQASRTHPEVNLTRVGYWQNHVWLLDAGALWPQDCSTALDDLEKASSTLQGLIKRNLQASQHLLELHKILKEQGDVKTAFSAVVAQIQGSTLSFALIGDAAIVHTNQFGELQRVQDTRTEQYLASQEAPVSAAALAKLLAKNQNKAKTFYNLSSGHCLTEKHLIAGQVSINQDFSVFLLSKQAQRLWDLNEQANTELLGLSLSQWASQTRPAQERSEFERDFCVLKIAPEKCIPTRTSLNWSY